MLLNKINSLVDKLGYRIIPKDDDYVNMGAIFSGENNFNLFSFKDANGNLDYQKYKAVQEQGNKNKIGQVWALEENIKFLAEELENRLGHINFGICHGTRRGVEQSWFKKYLTGSPEVIGTEISDTATDFPDTIQWDFHEVKDEWVNSVDFIYSNSFDHSYDPEKCLNAWMSCLRKGGLCVLEHTDHHSADSSRELDPFGAHLLQMPMLVSNWGKGKYGVREILKAPKNNQAAQYTALVVIEKF